MNSTATGRLAEELVAAYWQDNSYQILARNWRRPRCEIDIVAKKDHTVYFIEVKYRSNYSQGDGLEYITPKKIKKLKYAADCWNLENKWQGDWLLYAVSVYLKDGAVVLDQIIEIY